MYLYAVIILLLVWDFSRENQNRIQRDKRGSSRQWWRYSTAANRSDKRKHLKVRVSEASKINDIIYEWFYTARAENIPVNGSLLRGKVIEVAKKLEVPEFKASNRWLKKFKLRYKIVFKTMCGGSKDVDPETVKDWQGKLEKMCEPFDIFLNTPLITVILKILTSFSGHSDLRSPPNDGHFPRSP